jgi:hypothetical protein
MGAIGVAFAADRGSAIGQRAGAISSGTYTSAETDTEGIDANTSSRADAGFEIDIAECTPGCALFKRPKGLSNASVQAGPNYLGIAWREYLVFLGTVSGARTAPHVGDRLGEGPDT